MDCDGTFIEKNGLFFLSSMAENGVKWLRDLTEG